MVRRMQAVTGDVVPVGQTGTAGPLQIEVMEIITGADATASVTAASPANEAPRDGLTYVLIRLEIENQGAAPIILDGNDFGITGTAGIVRRFAGVVAPDPTIDGIIEPGDRRDGWVVLMAPAAEEQRVLLYDSLSLPGVWTDRAFALDEGARLPRPDTSLAPLNDAGIDVSNPVGFNMPIVTADWQVELLDVARGAAVFELVDYRTGALGVEDAIDDQPWLAFRLRITNVRAGGEPAYLPANAFAIIGEDGAPLLDLPTLTPPNPDASGAYFPGASREGWVAFEIPSDGVYTVRFLPYATITADPDPRYFVAG